MESLYFLIPLSIVFIIGAVALFFWAVNSGQYDDLESEAERILFDDDMCLSQEKPDDNMCLSQGKPQGKAKEENAPDEPTKNDD